MPKSPPSNSTRLKGKIRKAEIIASAASLFAEKGFNGTKTREIAARAGVSEALIFKYFPSKEDLYVAILAEESPVPRLLSQLRALAEKGNDEEVFGLIAKTIAGGMPDTGLMRLILYSALENHELSQMFFRNHIRLFYEFLTGYIQRRIDERVFRPMPAVIAARSFMGMLMYHRWLSELFGAHLAESPEEMARAFVDIMMNGLRRPVRRKGSRPGTRASASRKPGSRS